MFGVTLPVSNSSPVIRRAGSKPVFSEQDYSDSGGGNEEVSLLSADVEQMKSGVLPIHAAAILPSPVLLWRLKVLLFLIWGVSCCKISWDSVMRMSVDLRDLFLYEVFLYYNPLLLVTLMVWLWGINLWVFAQSTVNYAKIFDLDHSHLTHWEIWKLQFWYPTNSVSRRLLDQSRYGYGYLPISAAYLNSFQTNYFMFCIVTLLKRCYIMSPVQILSIRMRHVDDHRSANKYDSIPLSLLTWRSLFGGLSTSVILYAVVLMILIFPFDIFYLSSRYYFLRTLWRIILPLQAISFSDFFLADILTSMSKVLSDLERSACRMVNRQVATIAWFEADSICGSHSVAIPLVLVLPYLCRLFQCLRQYKDTKEKTSLFNALKYSTSIPVILLSALKYHVFPEQWTSFYRPLWLMSSLINSLYSFYWDLARDWDLSVFTRIFKFKTPHICTDIFYGRRWVYYWVISSNLILRCTWTYKLSAHLRHNYLTVFTIAALEIFRRFQWIFFRVENEWNKMTAFKSSMEFSMDEIPKEDDRLLGSSNHVV